jgi:hypothetical protein
MRCDVRTANKRRGASRHKVAACCKVEVEYREDERRRWHFKRTRGGSGATTVVTQQPAGEQEANGRHLQTRGGGLSRGQEASAAQQEAS